MASANVAGGGAAGKKRRWAGSKVYTRKSHSKALKPSPSAADSQPSLPSDETPTPPPPALPSSTASDDGSSLNQPLRSLLPNDRARTRSRQEGRLLRRRLVAELEQVRALAKRLEARELQLATVGPAAGYALSQLSATDPSTPASVSTKRAAPFRRPLSIPVPTGAESNPTPDSVEKEKHGKKNNQHHQNPEFLLRKEKFQLPPDPHGLKKSKSNSSKKHTLILETEAAAPVSQKEKHAQAFESCAGLLAKLMKHKHGWVFNTPVDAKALGLHDYYTIIKHPMDLGTVKARLGKSRYASPQEFAEDVRLTFRNAMAYNPKEQDVHVMAAHLLHIFEEQWPAIEAELAYYSPPATKKAPPIDTRDLERSDSAAHPMVVDSEPKPKNHASHHASHIGRSPPLKKPKAKDLNKREMTYEEKQRLSNNLQNLPPEKLDNVVQIIKKRNSSLSQHDDEIEVDIDSFDVETLWELDRFVTNYKKSLSKNKRKAELAVLARHEAEKNAQQVPKATVAEAPKEVTAVVSDKIVASSLAAEGEKKGNNASRSSASSSSSSGSGSSSDSDSDSSSACGSDAAHSPRT